MPISRPKRPGTIDQLIDQLRDKFHRQLPGADLLISNVYDALMTDVTDVKDLGSGVIGGKECDHLAFRAKDTDWQIWIAQGEAALSLPLCASPARASTRPRNSRWRFVTGRPVAAGADFTFTPPAGAKRHGCQGP